MFSIQRYRKHLRILIPATLAGLFAIGASATAFANKQPITDAQAKAIALKAVPGVVVKLEREDDEIEVVVRATDKSLKEVEIDAYSGKVLEIEDEDEDEDEGDENEDDEDNEEDDD